LLKSRFGLYLNRAKIPAIQVIKNTNSSGCVHPIYVHSVYIEIKAHSAQLELELGLSLATAKNLAA
jgi:molybdenum cofactor biosynthesis enzyme